MMNRKLSFGLLSLGLAAGTSMGAVTVIDMDIQTDTFDNFQFSVIHTADSNGGAGGSIVGRFAGSFRVEYDDNGTAGRGDDTVTFTRFSADIQGTGRATDIRLDSARGASTFSLDSALTSGGGNNIAGSLNLEVFEDGWKSIAYNFTSQDFNSLANAFFIGGDPQDSESDYTLGLWGLSDNINSLFGHTGDLGIDLVGRGSAIPMPTPIAMAGAGLLGLGAVRRRR